MKVGAKKRKIIIIALGVIAAGALLYVLFGRELKITDPGAAVENKKKMLRSQLETKLLEGPYEFYLQQYTSRLQENREKLLPGNNPKVAESELLKVLTDFAAKSGVEITQKIVQKETKVEDRLYKVSTRIVTRCTAEQLVQLLTDIRNYNRYLTIDEFTIATSGPRNRQSFELRPTLTVSGYITSTDTGVEGKTQDANM